MKAIAKKSTIVTLTLSEEEARWLADNMQNPAHPSNPDAEDPEDRKNRLGLCNVINNALEEPLLHYPPGVRGV